jgi:Pyruvate/2-oxoacid:ferredoxin oxidoreductase delta subunit
MPPGTTAIEQRTIASHVPVWEASNCTQCNICAFVCPHAAIRPVLATPEELSAAPAGFNTLPIKGAKDLAGYQYRVQVRVVQQNMCLTIVSCLRPCDLSRHFALPLLLFTCTMYRCPLWTAPAMGCACTCALTQHTTSMSFTPF